jgi:hypothetical protein
MCCTCSTHFFIEQIRTMLGGEPERKRSFGLRWNRRQVRFGFSDKQLCDRMCTAFVCGTICCGNVKKTFVRHRIDNSLPSEFICFGPVESVVAQGILLVIFCPPVSRRDLDGPRLT